MSIVLSKEVAPFKVRVLTPCRLQGSRCGANARHRSSGSSTSDGDNDKFLRVVYDIVVGKDMGEGHEAENGLPLGRDISPRRMLVSDQMTHVKDVFEEIRDNVFQEKE